VDGVSFEVPKGQFVTLLGPSGCGKTTTLRCIAGLEQPDEGQIVMAGQTVFDGAGIQSGPKTGRSPWSRSRTASGRT
jgi:iron(III) transport system ATP-binding protein